MSFLRKMFVLMTVGCFVAATVSASSGDLATPFDADNTVLGPRGDIDLSRAKVTTAMFPGTPVDFTAAQTAGAGYLRGMQADITEDNAGNGTNGVNEIPDDPDDGGWDWKVTSPPAPFFHTTAASSTNLYGATGIGLYYTYLESGGVSYLLAMTDAANTMANNPNVRSGADLVFLMLYNDLPGVAGTAYEDAARAKYDSRTTTYGSAQGLAEYIRDARAGQGYENGIIAWDIGVWARVAAMLDTRFPGNGYDTDAAAIAEVIYQDSYMDNPGYFDIVDDAGWDPNYADLNFYWYNLGITGLIDAFDAAGVHTGEIAGLVTLLLDGQAAHGGISYCYGAEAGDEDWQSTGYAMMTLGRLDQATYQSQLDEMGYFLSATQDFSGGWVYSSGNHYPEIGGECTAGLYYTTKASVFDLADAIVDDDFTWQADVDVYNDANGTNYIWGYDAFATIQEAIDAVDGSTVSVAAGTYAGNINIDKSLTMLGDPGDANPGPGASAPVIDGGSAPGNAFLIANGVTNVTIEGFEMRNFTSPLMNGIGNGISAWEASTSNITIRDNYFHDLGYNGVLVGNDGAAGDHTNWLIKNNIIEEFGYIGFELTNTSNSSIEDNVIHMMTPYIGAIFSSARRSETGLTIKNNLIDGSPSALYPVIYIYAYDLDMPNPNLNSVLIEGNTITTIGTPFQVYIRNINTGTVTGVTVVNNNLLSLKNATLETLNAEENWWGSVSHATISTLVDGDVDFDPWCSDDTHTNCTLTYPVSEVWVDDDWAGSSDGDAVGGHVFGYDAFATIQDGIDGVTGSTVNVAAGTYEEQLEIDKDLNLVGAGIGVTIVQSPTSLPLFFTTSANNYPIVYVHDAANVNISQMTVDGLGRGNANSRFYGIAYFNAGGVIDFVEVANIQDTPFSGAQHGNAIYRFDDDGLAYSMAISNCNVHTFQKNGITVNASAPAAVTVDIHDNTVTGEGATDVTAQNGIQVWGDLISGNVYDNVIDGIAYDNTAATTKYVATSILNYYADININSNTVTQGHLGIYNIDGAGTLNDNDLTIEKIGVYAYGIVATDPPQAVPAPVDADLLASPEDSRTSQRSALATLNVDVNGNTVTFVGTDNSATWGIEADAGYGPDDIAFSATYNSVSGFEVGIVAYNCLSSCGTGVFTSAVITNNELLNNDIGIETNEPLVVITNNGMLGAIGVQNDLVGTTIDASGNYYYTTDPTAVAAMIVGDVDYTPWLDDGASASPGFDGDFSALYIDDDSPQLGSSTRLIEAVGLVTASTVYVAAGTYAEGPQIVINKNVAIVGASKATVTITPTVSTGSDGDARGWFLVNSGMNLDMSEVTLDGAGFDIYQGIRHMGSGTLDNIDFSNMVYPGYGGVAVAAFGGTFVTISNSSFANIGRVGALMWVDGAFTGNTYTGKGDGDWLDYAVDMNAGANVSIVDNTISNCTGVASSDGSTSAGVMVTTLYGAGTTANCEGNSFTANSTGLMIGYDDSDASTVVATNGNTFVDNGTGVSTTASSAITLTAYGNFFDNTVNADDDAGGTWDDGAGQGNCWSDFATNSGFPLSYLVGGDAAAVDNYPNTGTCGVGFDVADIFYDCSGSFSFGITMGPEVIGMEVASFTIIYPSGVSPVSVVAASGNLSIFTSIFDGNAADPDTLIIDFSVLSGSLDGPAELVTIGMGGATDICSGDVIQIATARYRTSENIDIYPAVGAPITITADCADPVFTINSPSSGGFYNSAPVIDFGVTDNCEIDAIYYQADNCAGGTWTAIATGVGGATYADAAWEIPDFAALSDQASHCFYFKVVDVNGRGNSDSCSSNFCFTKDMIAPAPPTDLLAESGHNKVKLSWTSPGDPDLAGIKIQRVAWGDYPEYGSAPLYPANETEGTNVFDALGANYVDVLNLNNTTRDIYYYSAFSYDAAGNYSVAIAAAQDRSTSYWLGDLTDATTAPGIYDGYVYFGDLARFSIAYGKAQGDPGFDNEADFGPTVTGNTRGIPAPDDSVGFEDLAIFAINFDAVGPTMKVVPYFADGSSSGELTLALSGKEVDGKPVYGLSVVNNIDQVQAFRAVISKDSKAKLKNVVLSDEIQEASAPMFYYVTERENQVIFDFAVLGQGVSIGGSGEFVTFEFVSEETAGANVELVDGTLRDCQNSELSVVLESIGVGQVPKDFALHQNYPNPFNPTTMISLDIPKAAEVRVEVFNMLGQTVRVLVDGYFEAGSYDIEWNGRSDAGNQVASGMYFYRMTAGDHTSTRKMMLLK